MNAGKTESIIRDHNMPLEIPGSSDQLSRVPLSCMFLSNFEMKRGNEAVWFSKVPEAESGMDLENIEFKSLPSGVHGVADDVIHFVVPKRFLDDEYYYGVAYYKQNGQEMTSESGQLDRNKVKMYALGVIIDPASRADEAPNDRSTSWRPEELTAADEYIEDIQQLLQHWLAKKDFQDYQCFEKYFECNSLSDGGTGKTNSTLIGKKAKELLPNDGQIAFQVSGKLRILDYLPYWIRKLGPLIFPLWKSCLLGERILIMNPPGGSFEVCNSLAFSLSIISAIPEDLQINNHGDRYVRPIFTIGISDIDKMAKKVTQAAEDKEEPSAFVACTSDEILFSKTELYDKFLRVPNGPDDGDVDVCTVHSSSGVEIKATPHDFECLKAFYQDYLGEEMSQPEIARLSRTVEPISWMQYFIDEFYWWSTAGYVKPFYHEKLHAEKTSTDDKSELILDIIRYFHQRTTIIYNRLKTVVDTYGHQDPDEMVLLPFTALNDMGLDLFSAQDQELVVALTRKWFHREIKVSSDYCEAVC